VPYFAPHQRFSGVGVAPTAPHPTPTPPIPGPAAPIRRLDRLGRAVTGRDERTTPAVHGERSPECPAIYSGEEIA
jgi:hypothetical protein